ncbi:prolipoprotein diacylglyceryl transferase [Lactonifactor longoviformis]|uniref:Phosphatidylglycerol--prolipoprotein diacylglyceryl transferase n=1 Tax=Lactonifactor longoviformis DSM 17459 TaxID=1122155 RepID=A0A1M4SZ31_9CLOT|nr:prolipoprotein diacylglyceryl transferase [Lactonifactor longoviformis]POP30344.1 prolipoprotein diacylglyceryl transferase [Lactonifactor longoviformis]SHE37441.1 phosphatidylglycerol:prolipoprotein diacylglycerol transferase [Lactonifactor longoviformis DSM 17459]
MKNDLFSIGPLTIHGYGLMIAIGVLAAYLVGEYRAKKNNLNPEPVFAITFLCLIGGLLGAKLLFFITDIKEILENPKVLLDLSYGFVVYGGILGGILTFYIYSRYKKLNFLQYFDILIPSVALAQGFGRIGCFLAGCCYGMESSCPFSITFHSSEFAPNGIPLIPTQLISSGLNFIHFFLLIYLAKKVKAHGQIAALYLILYSAGRFILEFFRGDLIRGSVGALSTSQFISIFTFLAGIIFFWFCGKKYKKGTGLSESGTP